MDFMDQETIRLICETRLEGWGRKLVSDMATPLILIGIGHEEMSGTLVLCTVEDTMMRNELLVAFLRKVIQILEEKTK